MNLTDLTLNDVQHTAEYTIGCLSMPTGHGDTRTFWDTRVEASVAEVRAIFDEMVKVNHLMAYKVEAKGDYSGEQIKDFDPEAERIVLAKPLVGG